MKETILYITSLLVLIALVVSGLLWVAAVRCHKEWARSGMSTEFVLFAGCQLQVGDGKWIPAASYREMP